MTCGGVSAANSNNLLYSNSSSSPYYSPFSSPYSGNFLERIGHPYDSGPPCSGCQGHCKGRRLCTNSCPYGDLWMNCRELQRSFPPWLCNSKTKEGLERLRSCRATCMCKGKITYP
ncbi:Cysteine-rich secretory protein 1 [Portunus trituberculatus]|uniref:Cysteine-rich secretory protein 1 n=1 Tax=Portunus trituberculatus TaxID=210409 RepID=A0A5B7G8S2_PORTR|nr:Cysteine-rich secretory protein 1 [Portunus trituberculatus]